MGNELRQERREEGDHFRVGQVADQPLVQRSRRGEGRRRTCVRDACVRAAAPRRGPQGLQAEVGQVDGAGVADGAEDRF